MGKDTATTSPLRAIALTRPGMQPTPQPITQDLVLVGGGHSHALVLRQWAMDPVPGVRLTVINQTPQTPYSGMLPGYVAGLYTYDECHIDLRRLCQFAGVQFWVDEVVGLDLAQQRVLCAQHPPVAFDWLSLDIGSTPTVTAVPGAVKYAIAAKPIPALIAGWDALRSQVAAAPEQDRHIVVVGGGAGGVELTLAIHRQLTAIYCQAGQPADRLTLHLIHRGAALLPGENAWVTRQLTRILGDRGVQIHLQEQVTAVEPDRVCCASGLEVPSDRTFWVTQASAAPWIRAAGLATDEQGFLAVNDGLQSISHPRVFGAGDIATMVNHPRPKAGVFAVRQGKPLADNLRRSLRGEPLKPYRPQKQFLKLIGTGDEQAIAVRGPLGVGPWPLLWRWKDAIDRRFMERFNELPVMEVTSAENSEALSPMRCAGCGSKVGSSVLERVLARIRAEHPPGGDRLDILIGLDAPDDAAVVAVPSDRLMVHTLDYFRALVADPFQFGQIATQHCLSDLYAMGAEPQSVLAMVTVPYGTEAKIEETLYQLLSGALQALGSVPLVGGHTTEGPELVFGLACNGLVAGDRLLRKGGLAPGDALILTKALGTGTLFAADMRYQAKGEWIEAALASMRQSNQAAAQCLQATGAIACTDITGFGLLGHLVEMVRASAVDVTLDLAALPWLPGAAETLAQGLFSSLHPENLRSRHWIANLAEAVGHPRYPILFDPQTSGGLLAGVPGDRAADCVAQLQALGYRDSALIGHVTPRTDAEAPIHLVLD